MKRAVLVNPGRRNFGELQRDGNHTDDNVNKPESFKHQKLEVRQMRICQYDKGPFHSANASSQ